MINRISLLSACINASPGPGAGGLGRVGHQPGSDHFVTGPRRVRVCSSCWSVGDLATTSTGTLHLLSHLTASGHLP